MNDQKNIPVSNFLIQTITQTIKAHNDSSSNIKLYCENIVEIVNFGSSHEIEDLIVEIAEYKSEYIIKLLSVLYKVFGKDLQNDLTKAIDIEKNMYYLEDEYIQEISKIYNSFNEGNQISYIQDLEEKGGDAYKEGNIEESDIYLKQLLVIEGSNFGNIYYFKSSFYGNKDSITSLPSIRYNSNKLIYNSKDIELKGYQMKFCQFLFKDGGISKEDNWKEIIRKVYGENKSPPNNGVKNLVAEINKKLILIGCKSQLIYSDGIYVKLHHST